MNKKIITIILSLISSKLIAQPGNFNQNPPKIQLAILFDASNSMDGLIDQAKSRIWNIVNELSSLKYKGQNTILEIALYEYGKSTLSPTVNYVNQLAPLTSDLDLISQNLFGLITNGGEEYCGAVIQQSIKDLKWSTLSSDLKMIYIAGNEPFNQGPINYKEVCKLAIEKNIFVNTIYCGPYNQGKVEFWYDGAISGKGDYFAIDSDKKIEQIVTPYDNQINTYNDSLNKTYYGYGKIGLEKKSNQMAQDKNAEVSSAAVKTERSIAKTKSSYSNASWDLIDAVEKDGKDISKMADEELPEEFKGKTEEEKKLLIEEKTEERKKYQSIINDLAKKRTDFILSEKAKTTNSTETDDFGTSINKSIEEKAKMIGFEKVVVN